MPKILTKEDKTKFRAYLDQHNIHPDKVAMGTGLPASSAYQIVMGYHDNPSLNTIKKILAYLGCRFEDIF